MSRYRAYRTLPLLLAAVLLLGLVAPAVQTVCAMHRSDDHAGHATPADAVPCHGDAEAQPMAHTPAAPTPDAPDHHDGACCTSTPMAAVPGASDAHLLACCDAPSPATPATLGSDLLPRLLTALPVQVLADPPPDPGVRLPRCVADGDALVVRDVQPLFSTFLL